MRKTLTVLVMALYAMTMICFASERDVGRKTEAKAITAAPGTTFMAVAEISDALHSRNDIDVQAIVKNSKNQFAMKNITKKGAVLCAECKVANSIRQQIPRGIRKAFLRS